MIMRARKVSQGISVPMSPKGGNHSPLKNWLNRELIPSYEHTEYIDAMIQGKRIDQSL